MHQIQFRLGLHLRPAEGVYSTPQASELDLRGTFLRARKEGTEKGRKRERRDSIGPRSSPYFFCGSMPLDRIIVCRVKSGQTAIQWHNQYEYVHNEKFAGNIYQLQYKWERIKRLPRQALQSDASSSACWRTRQAVLDDWAWEVLIGCHSHQPESEPSCSNHLQYTCRLSDISEKSKNTSDITSLLHQTQCILCG